MIHEDLTFVADGLSMLDTRDPEPGLIYAEPNDTGCGARELFEAEMAEGGDDEVHFVVEFAEGDGVGKVVERHGGVLGGRKVIGFGGTGAVKVEA